MAFPAVRRRHPHNRIVPGECGSVSIFLIVVLAAFFLFNAVLIDFVRCKAAERQSELALKTSVRSTLSAFDLDLHKYGLFALGPENEQVEHLFFHVLQQNLSAGEGESFVFLNARVEGEPSVRTLYSLANRPVFQRQMLEDMKYIAPIEIARRLSGPFKRISGDVSTAARFSQDAEAVEALIAERENLLDLAWKVAGDTLRQVETMAARYARDADDLRKTAREIGNLNKEQVRKDLLSLEEDFALADIPPEARMMLREEIGNLTKILGGMERYGQLVRSLKAQTASDETALANAADKFARRIDEARNLNRRIGEKIREIREKNGQDSSLNDIFAGLHTNGEEEHIRMKRDFAQAVSAFSSFRLAAQQLRETDYGQKPPSDQSYVRVMRLFYDKHKENEQKRQAANADKREKEKNAQNKADAEVNRAKKTIVSSCTPQDAERYDRLEGQSGLAGKFMDYNELSRAAASGASAGLDGGAESLARKGLSLLEAALSRLETLRDELYINEYVLHRFNYRTNGKAADVKKLSEPANHQLKDQEAEYVLYGFSSCEKNMAAAYEELFLLRMALRTVEALLHPQQPWAKAGTPMLVLLTAVAQGAKEAYADTDKLLQGKEVEIAGNLPEIALTYADYLRLFMLLHGDGMRMSARTQALIELNTGIDLTKKFTSIAAAATVSLKLWFLPAAIAQINPRGELAGEVRNGRWRIVRAAEMSY